MFWAGIFIGLFIGSNVGIITAAWLITARLRSRALHTNSA